MRKVTLQSTASLKINTGNYETVDVSKTMSVEIEFEKPDELVEKSKNHDAVLIQMLKAEAESALEQIGRRRVMKIAGQDTPVELWKSYVNEKK